MHHVRHRRIGRERGRQHHRAGARAAAAVRGREGLVQVDVHGVDAEIAGPHAPDDGVEVGAVAIEVAARPVHRVGDVDDVVLEQAAGVGVGDHGAGDVGAELGLEGGEIDAAAIVGGHRIDLVAAGRRGRGIGAVRGFRHQDALARIALGQQRGADGHDAAQLAMRAGGRRHRDRRHVGQRLQPVRQLVDQLQRALHGGDRLHRMQIADAGQPRHLLVEARIVLHGAGAERIDAHVDGVVLLAHLGVVAHHLRLAQARQADLALALQAAEAVLVLRDRGQVDAAAALHALLEDQRLFDLQALVAGDRAHRAVRRGSASARSFMSTSLSAAS